MSKSRKNHKIKGPASVSHIISLLPPQIKSLNPEAGGKPHQHQLKSSVDNSRLNFTSETNRKKPLWHVMLLSIIIIVTVAVYIHSLHNGFVQFDDPEIIVDNTSIRQLTWENVCKYFTSAPQFTYSPLVFVSFAVDYQLGQLNPFVYHLTSLLLHLMSILSVYWLFQLLTERWYLAAFIATLFAIHPVNVDGISWLSTRSNVLYTFFYLASLLGYVYYLKTNYKLRYLILSLLFFVCAVLSKSPAVVLVVTLFLLDYYYDRKPGQQRGRRWKLNGRLFIEKAPFVLTALAIGVITFYFHTDIQHPYDYNVVDRFFVFCTALANYFFKLFFPFNLAFAYAYPAKIDGFLPWYCYLMPLSA